MPMPRHLSIVLLSASVLAVAACEKEVARVAPPPPKVTVAHPEVRELVEYDQYNGWIDATDTVEVRARVRGHIQKIDFTDGEIVKKDQLLFELDPRPFEANVARANDQLKIYQAQTTAAQKEEARLKELLSKGGSSQSQVDKAEADRKDAALANDGFGGDRAHAKVAMLGAMYGATSGEAGRLLATLRARYPDAMACVENAARQGEGGGVVYSILGRACPPPSQAWREVVELGSGQDATDPERRRASQYARDRGRFTRNFVVQASAADWASVWLSGVRRDLTAVAGAELVFFQHDELIVHVPSANAPTVAEVTIAAAEAARRLVFPTSSVTTPVRPVIVDCYADAK